MNAVEAQDIGSERAQTRKDARIAADAAGVLGETAVTHVMGAILDVPVVTDGFGTLSGWQRDVADKQGGLAGIGSRRKVGGNWCSGISDGMRLSLHAARSMH